jgi:pimeloyl-ACP methyl ester carboxylesterase
MRDDVDHTKTLIVGASMGGGVALAAIPRLAPRGLRGVVVFAPPSDYAPLVAGRVAPLGPIAPVAQSIVGVVSGGLGHVSPFELAPGRGLETGPDVPILLFHGDADATIPLALSEELASRVDQVELRVLPGVGHDELPGAVLDDASSRVRVLQFLRYPRARDGS